ncbi:putative baseplate assembly protein [Paenibacillus sp. MBLB4367]|uniref:putative baseplate assembly protein n=1 Tax=Paenibacillus sp. MBLB4367 TaxID=3384767 RepID=UPI0039081116
MLPIPNLDDRTFEQLVKEARRSIPHLQPQWTDENAHDPGVTMIELFAWLTEMQQYYMNRVTISNERKFLKLLGVHPKEPAQARADVSFEGAMDRLVLPAGTRLMAMDQHFETERTLELIPARLEKVLTRVGTITNDATSSNDHAAVSFYPFGQEPKRDNRLYLGFDRPFPEGADVTLSMLLFNDYPVAVGGEDGQTNGRRFSSARVSWRYYGAADGGAEGWLPVETVRDDTVELSESGSVVLKVHSPMKPLPIQPANDRSRYWLCCTLEAEGYELSPKLQRVCLNTVSAIQQETASAVYPFACSGEPGWSCTISGYLPFYGKVQVQVRDERGVWRYWRQRDGMTAAKPGERCCSILKNESSRSLTVTFGDGTRGAIPAKSEDGVRIIAFEPDFEETRLIGRSSGLPGQAFEWDAQSCIRDGFMLQVGKKQPGETELVWEDWIRVDDFDNSGPYDRHYVLDADTNELRFGNNEQGILPAASEADNICILAYRRGGGRRGNVKERFIRLMEGEHRIYADITAVNHAPAKGGTERETIQDAKERALRELRTPTRAVTSEDYEYLAANTPGLRVARVKAIPLYTKGKRDYPRQKSPGQMTVVVVPYSESDHPKASPGFLQTVKAHLDQYRLITTELHVIPAEYIKVTVHAVVVLQPHVRDADRRVREELRKLLSPMARGNGASGWSFGRTVYKGDVYGAINRVTGVEYVQDLWLDADGGSIAKEADGDIRIPPYGLVYSGEHEIELVSITDAF